MVGVNIDVSSDGSGQQWRSVEDAVIRDMNDIIVVGRAVCESKYPIETLIKYRDAAWAALSAREMT